MFYTRPTCPRCGQVREEPLAIPTLGLLKQTLEYISRVGGLHCEECAAEVNRLWVRNVRPTLNRQ